MKGKFFNKKTSKGRKELEKTKIRAVNGDLDARIQLAKYYYRIHKYDEAQCYLPDPRDSRLSEKERQNVITMLWIIRDAIMGKKSRDSFYGFAEVMKSYPTPAAASRRTRGGNAPGYRWNG